MNKGKLVLCCSILVLCQGWSSAILARGAGMIFGIDLGGAVVSGKTDIALQKFRFDCSKDSGAAQVCRDMIRTDAGSGFGFGLRLGYNFFGYASAETYLMGHFNTDSGGGNKLEGAAHWGFLGRYFFLQHVPDLARRWYDPYVYFGGGPIGYMGYHESIRWEKKMRGWKGGHVLFGLGGDFYVNDHVSFGLDLRFYKPFYKTYIYDWDDDITFTPKSSPSTLVFMPMATINFHFMGPEATGTRLRGEPHAVP